MRKWTYLVAALLMSGTAATFTSCIDTKIDVEIKKCSLQLEQLKVEKQTKQNEWEVAAIDEQIKLLAQQTEQQLLKLKTQNLQSQAEYEKAVIDLEAVMATYRDDKYVGSIQAAITALNRQDGCSNC